MRTIIENDKLGYYLNELSMNGYRYIIKAKDKFLSGWGSAGSKSHIQLIAARDEEEKSKILQDLYKDPSFNYVTYFVIPNENDKLIKLSYKYSYTIRNDWTRCF